MIASLVVKIIFVVAEITFIVDVFTSAVSKITVVVTEITSGGCDLWSKHQHSVSIMIIT